MKKAMRNGAVKKHGKTMPRVIGRVTPKERDEVQALYERKNGLKELVISLQQNQVLLTNEAFYEKLVADMGRTTTKFQNWWDARAEAYGWENVPGCFWTINFETCEIVLNERK